MVVETTACPRRSWTVGMAVGRFVDGEFFHAEYFLGEKDHGVERLFLCGSRDLTLQCQIIEVIE